MAVPLPSLNALRAFEAAARHESFTKAAEELNFTQGAISHRIKGLEAQLGRPLFRRIGRRIELTEVGEDYLPVVRDAFDRLMQGTERLFGAAGLDTLAVTLMPTFAMTWMIPRLAAFHAAHPNIEVHLVTTDRVVDLSREDVDFGIRTGPGTWPGLRADRLFAYDLVAVCSPELRDGPVALETPADLVRHTLLHNEEDEEDWALWLDAVGVDAIDPESGRWYDNTALVLSAAHAGLGVALAPHAYVEDEIAEGWLVTAFDFVLEVDEAFYLVCPEATAERPRMVAFRDWLRAEAAQEDAKQRARRQRASAR